MNNKFVLSRGMVARMIRENLYSYIAENVILARYETTVEEVQHCIETETYEGEKGIVIRNFYTAWKHILDSEGVEGDYDFLIDLHRIMMKDLINGKKHDMTEEQQREVKAMINQPVKAQTEVALDVMLYILDKRLFVDGDVRAAIMFANKILLDGGNGVLLVKSGRVAEFRERLHEFHETHTDDFKTWLYRYCIIGMKNDAFF